jgi:hypothetical protein
MRLIAAVLLAIVLAASPAPAGQPTLRDLNGTPVELFKPAPGTKAVVLIFVSVECPISNRYAPEVRRLYDRFSAENVAFYTVYPNPAESDAAIRTHLKEYGFPPAVLLDPRQELAKFAGASITPEAVVYDTQRRRVYRGRIDDRYVSLGLERPKATRYDLEEALTATLAGRQVAAETTQAVGCYIADFAR